MLCTWLHVRVVLNMGHIVALVRCVRQLHMSSSGVSLRPRVSGRHVAAYVHMRDMVCLHWQCLLGKSLVTSPITWSRREKQ